MTFNRDFVRPAGTDTRLGLARIIPTRPRATCRNWRRTGAIDWVVGVSGAAIRGMLKQNVQHEQKQIEHSITSPTCNHAPTESTSSSAHPSDSRQIVPLPEQGKNRNRGTKLGRKGYSSSIHHCRLYKQSFASFRAPTLF